MLDILLAKNTFVFQQAFNNTIKCVRTQVQPIIYPQLQQPKQHLYQPLQLNQSQTQQGYKKQRINIKKFLNFMQQQTIFTPQIKKQQDSVNHVELSLAGYMEKRSFNLQILKYFFLFQTFPLILCYCSFKNYFIKFSYNLNGYFKQPFYIFATIMCFSLIYSYMNHKKLRNKQLRIIQIILIILYTFSYAFFIQAIYSSTYLFYNPYNCIYENTLKNYGNDQIVIILLCLINLETCSIFSYCMQEIGELSIKNSLLPTVTFGSILSSFYYNYDILCFMIALSCVLGFYLQFTLKRMINSKKFKLLSDEGRFSAMLLSFILFVPFFDLVYEDSEQLCQITQSVHSEQKNVQ
ncbi:unnamed protein product [Paramecium pentaurelia]|uniref:Transmembrane protein n=1 Tax=Paramecium pentaurelia TaxID=43138 RepID=A0A8S1UPS0_9CILI|nr:unnamed protein product [Paramecium pentaurelia]